MKKHIKLLRKLSILILLLVVTGWVAYDDSTVVGTALAAPCCQSCGHDFEVCMNNCGTSCNHCYVSLNFCNRHCVECDYTCSDVPDCPAGYICDPVNQVCIPEVP